VELRAQAVVVRNDIAFSVTDPEGSCSMRSPAEVSAMACPVCRVPLAMSDRQGIEIDYCPQCRGVWLDRGELDKIIERSVPAEAAPAPRYAAPPPPERSDWSGHDRGSHGHAYGSKPYKKKKHWLSELFDD